MSTVIQFQTRDRALPFRDRRRLSSRHDIATVGRSFLDRRIESLAGAIRALDDRFADETAPADLDLARGFARAVVACHTSGVPVSEAEVEEAVRVLAIQLRLLGVRS